MNFQTMYMTILTITPAFIFIVNINITILIMVIHSFIKTNTQYGYNKGYKMVFT